VRALHLVPFALLLAAPYASAQTPPPAAAPASTAPAAPAPSLTAPPTLGSGLQGPQERSRRYSAYALPRGTWAFDLGMFSGSGNDVFARLGAAVGLGAGLELDVNVGHYVFGLFNASARWQFVGTKHFALGASVGVWYAHGDWLWIYGGLIKRLIDGLDIVNIPTSLTASFPISRWLQLDVGVQYRHSEAFGEVIEPFNVLAASELAMRQFAFIDSVRVYLTDATAIEGTVKLPVYSGVASPTLGRGGLATDYESVPFWRTWSFEIGVRSRFAKGLFGNVRLQYGQALRTPYEAAIYPSFDVELRL
jgi:hypothetical protein